MVIKGIPEFNAHTANSDYFSSPLVVRVSGFLLEINLNF